MNKNAKYWIRGEYGGPPDRRNEGKGADSPHHKEG